MHFRSIISVFLLVCLVVLSFLGNVAEGGKALDNKHLKKNDLLIQRMKRRASIIHRLSKRDGLGGSDGGFQPEQPGYQAQQAGDLAQQPNDQPQQFGSQAQSPDLQSGNLAQQPNDQPQQFDNQAQPGDAPSQNNGVNQGGSDGN